MPAGRCAAATTPRPALERNIERFTQYLTLVGLTALLVGGVGVANAIRGHLDRKRDTIATMKSLGATGGSVFTIYLTQAMALAFIGAIPGLILGAALPFLIAWGFGIDPAAAARADAASRGPRARVALRPAHRARVRDLAARARARRVGLGAVPRRGGAGAALAAHDLCGADRAGGRGAGGAGGEARLRPAHRRDLRGGRRRRVRLAAAGREPGDGGREARAAPALDRAAARDRQHPPARRAHDERRAVARVSASRCSSP